MQIERLSYYSPQHKLPLHVEIRPEEFNRLTVGEEVDVRYDDPEAGPEAPSQRAVLVSKQVKPLRDVSPYMIALCGHTADLSEARERIMPGDGPGDLGREVSVLIFCRVDKAEEFIKNSPDIIDPHFSKEDCVE